MVRLTEVQLPNEAREVVVLVDCGDNFFRECFGVFYQKGVPLLRPSTYRSKDLHD